jgi:hypothetical protein
MNSEALAIIRDAAIFRGELKRNLIALGTVILVALVILAIQAFMERTR